MIAKSIIGYVHTLRGQIAFYDGCQIIFAAQGNHQPIKAESDLATIKRQQRATFKWRESQGFDYERKIYGHRRVIVTEERP